MVGKKIKQEVTSAEDYNTETDAVNLSLAYPATNSQSDMLLPNKPLPHCLKPQHGHSLACEGSVEPEVELPAGGSCMRGTTEQAESCSSVTETMETTAGIFQGIKVIPSLFMCVFNW